MSCPVLCGRGRPRIRAVYATHELVCALQYLREWSIDAHLRRSANTQREGVYISDFQTADKAVVECIPLPDDADIVSSVLRSAVAPGRYDGDDKLALPPRSSVKVESAVIDKQEYTYMQFPSETVTSSGYNVRRRNFAVAAVRGNRLFSLVASARSDLYNPEKADILVYIVQSFRLR